MSFRFSTRPHKQFLWLLIRRDSRISKGMRVGLDAGCADMRNKRFFQTDTYIGLDPDKKLLNRGLQKYKDAKGLNCKILDAPPGLTADFIQCIQVFVNADFAKHEAVEVTQKLVAMVGSGGALLMNTGKMTLQYNDEIIQILKTSFEKVSEIQYGDFGIKNTNMVFSLLISMIMFVFPSTRKFCGHKKTYFCCTNKNKKNATNYALEGD